jgi:ABC-type molybdenum transport system ATPase subunit/photorepair protein PhrA
MSQESFDPPLPPVPFVGREEEIQWLSQRLSLARSSRYEVDFLIIGEAGIGKTALVAEFARRALQRSSTVWIDGSSWGQLQTDARALLGRVKEEIRLRRDEGRGTTVIIDGLNEVNQRLAVDLYYRIRDEKIVRRVITTSREHPRLRIPTENQR